MEFQFDVNEYFKKPIVEIRSNLLPPDFAGDRRSLWNTVTKVAEIVNEMGEASAIAQGLSKSITTADRLRQSEQCLYFLVDQQANSGRGAVTGMLKIGKKGLYVFDREGRHYQVTPPCVLDFYVHEKHQRHGLGKQLFEHMLQNENISPCDLAIDRPSPKFLNFLTKHYNLSSPITQMNNYVVFDGFFPEDVKGDQNEKSPSNRINGLQREITPSAQSINYGRYGAPRPPCSMGQIIHNHSPLQKTGELTSPGTPPPVIQNELQQPPHPERNQFFSESSSNFQNLPNQYITNLKPERNIHSNANKKIDQNIMQNSFQNITQHSQSNVQADIQTAQNQNDIIQLRAGHQQYHNPQMEHVSQLTMQPITETFEQIKSQPEQQLQQKQPSQQHMQPAPEGLMQNVDGSNFVDSQESNPPAYEIQKNQQHLNLNQTSHVNPQTFNNQTFDNYQNVSPDQFSINPKSNGPILNYTQNQNYNFDAAEQNMQQNEVPLQVENFEVNNSQEPVAQYRMQTSVNMPPPSHEAQTYYQKHNVLQMNQNNQMSPIPGISTMHTNSNMQMYGNNRVPIANKIIDVHQNKLNSQTGQTCIENSHLTYNAPQMEIDRNDQTKIHISNMQQNEENVQGLPRTTDFQIETKTMPATNTVLMNNQIPVQIGANSEIPMPLSSGQAHLNTQMFAQPPLNIIDHTIPQPLQSSQYSQNFQVPANYQPVGIHQTQLNTPIFPQPPINFANQPTQQILQNSETFQNIQMPFNSQFQIPSNVSQTPNDVYISPGDFQSQPVQNFVGHETNWRNHSLDNSYPSGYQKVYEVQASQQPTPNAEEFENTSKAEIYTPAQETVASLFQAEAEYLKKQQELLDNASQIVIPNQNTEFSEQSTHNSPFHNEIYQTIQNQQHQNQQYNHLENQRNSPQHQQYLPTQHAHFLKEHLLPQPVVPRLPNPPATAPQQRKYVPTQPIKPHTVIPTVEHYKTRPHITQNNSLPQNSRNTSSQESHKPPNTTYAQGNVSAYGDRPIPTIPDQPTEREEASNNTSRTASYPLTPHDNRRLPIGISLSETHRVDSSRSPPIDFNTFAEGDWQMVGQKTAETPEKSNEQNPNKDKSNDLAKKLRMRYKKYGLNEADMRKTNDRSDALKLMKKGPATQMDIESLKYGYPPQFKKTCTDNPKMDLPSIRSH